MSGSIGEVVQASLRPVFDANNARRNTTPLTVEQHLDVSYDQTAQHSRALSFISELTHFSKSETPSFRETTNAMRNRCATLLWGFANPRFVRNEMPHMVDLQRQQARKKRGSIRYKRLGRQVAKLHERIGNLRREFLHQTTSRMVASCAVLATEELRTRNMSRSAKGTQVKPGRMVKQKAGLNREILSAGLSMAHNMLAYKAVEAGTRLHVSNTRQLKPSQRCAACWEIVPKTLAQRMHVCPHCGHTAQRDQNAASVVLIDAHTPGTGVAARPKPLARQRVKSNSVTRETPDTASTDA